MVTVVFTSPRGSYFQGLCGLLGQKTHEEYKPLAESTGVLFESTQESYPLQFTSVNCCRIRKRLADEANVLQITYVGGLWVS